MNWVELISFLVMVVAMTVIVYRRMKEEKRRREHPEEFADEEKREQERLRDFLRTMDIEPEKEEEPQPQPEPVQPPPSPEAAQESPFGRPREDFFEPELETITFTTDVEQQRYIAKTGRGFERPFGEIERDLAEKYGDTDPLYALEEGEELSMAAKALYRLPTPKDMVILAEIFGKPRGW